MSRPLRLLIPGGFYHVTCRGNDRRAIFKDDRDRTVFLEKLQGSLATYQVELHAYVLMDNHFHVMVCTAKGNLSEFMRHFNISYTAAYNRRHRRVRIPTQIDTHSAGKTTLVPIQIGTCSDANRHPC